jgi:VIT1/CCC1 family predicted Fe2+/Mn2+ transporter
MAHDAIGAHAREELGINEIVRARPLQAAMASAASFISGAAIPLLSVLFASQIGLIPLVTGASLACLALLGGLAAKIGGAGVVKGSLRVLFWSALAMAITASVGSLFGKPL